MKKNEHGFSAIEGLLVLVIVALVGFVGWYVWDSKEKTDIISSAQNQQQANETATPSSTYLTLQDYKVRVPLNDKTSGLKLTSVEVSSYSESDKAVIILASELDDNWTCEADESGQKGTIGSISVTPQDMRSGPYEPVVSKKVGSYTFGFEAGGANCTDDPLYDELVGAFKTQFEQLEAY